MRVCQTNTKKNPDTVGTKQQSRQPANTAKEPFGKQNPAIFEIKGTFALRVVTQLTAKRLCPLVSNLHGGVGLALPRPIAAGNVKTPNEWHFLKREDTHEKKERREATPSKSGNLCRKSMGLGVSFVENVKNSPKTISFLCLRVVQITYQTYNHCVAVVTAKNGQIDIHQHPQLLEQE